MPRLLHATPKYRLHRASGQAVVTVAGRVHYLGPHGTKASKNAYDRVVGEWMAAGRPTVQKATAEELTVTELVASFWKFAQQHYRKNGRATGTAENFRPVLSLLKKRYGQTPAAKFGPLALKAMMAAMVAEGGSRRYVNDNLHRIRRIWRWAQSEQRLPKGIYEDLMAVECLAKGNTPAKESEPVRPVADATVDATLAHLPDVVADMVSLQRLTGARPGEVCLLRPCDIDRSEAVWRYVPETHKTEHHGKQRTIFIGPRAQEILRPYLLREETEYCFRPCDSERRRRQELHEQRVTPMSCGNTPKAHRKKGRQPGRQYTNDSYRRAIARACELAFGMPEELRVIPAKLKPEERQDRQRRAIEWRERNTWAPNQLRHNVATFVRKTYGLEAAQVILGHSKASMTEVYAERDEAKAASVMAEVG